MEIYELHFYRTWYDSEYLCDREELVHVGNSFTTKEEAEKAAEWYRRHIRVYDHYDTVTVQMAEYHPVLEKFVPPRQSDED